MCPPLLSSLIPDNYRLTKNNCLLFPCEKSIVANCVVLRSSCVIQEPHPFFQVEQSQSPQPFQIQMKCIRGIKHKAPKGSYLLQVSLLGRLGGCVLQWWQTEKLKTRTHPVRHDGNFYDVGLYFHESLYVVSWFFCTHITFYLASPLSVSICLFIPIHTALILKFV